MRVSMAFTSAQRAPEKTCHSERGQSFVSRHDERLDSSYEKEHHQNSNVFRKNRDRADTAAIQKDESSLLCTSDERRGEVTNKRWS